MSKKMDSSSLTCKKLTIITVLAVLIQAFGLALFVLGFFPVKPALSGFSGVESFYPPGTDSAEFHNTTNLSDSQLKYLYQELSLVPPLFDRLILMVIDGLPAEFVLGKDGEPAPKAFKDAMPYTQSLLSKGRAIGYHAKAAPPTVTMPRLKAMVSGAVGGFLDVAFNFNTQALLDDNIIVQFLKVGWKMVMHGDETWLKLFPGMFSRHDGVSSFFVKDTVQVDQNVSRHLVDELSRADWSLLILHYLGLDHVGHLGGRNSVLMAPKLGEMDEVIKTIVLNSLPTNNNDQGRTLLLVVSDHGMTENGNHGGSSFEETDSLALFIGPTTFGSTSGNPNKANQVDLASTLSLLFGVPIPKNNVGMLMAETFKSLTVDQQLRLLELNSWQLLRLLEAQLPGLVCENFSCDDFRDDKSERTRGYSSLEETFCCLYMKAADLQRSRKSGEQKSEDNFHSTLVAYHNFLRTASEWLSHRATDKPVGRLIFGVAAMLVSCLILLSLLFLLGKQVFSEQNQQFSSANHYLSWRHLDEIFIVVVIIIVVMSMGSSSLVEEEQYIWHFMTSSLYLLSLRKVMQQNTNNYIQIWSTFVILISGRFLRGWHQGGVNWTHLPDISKWLEQAGSPYIKLFQLVSGNLLISISLVSLLWSRKLKKNFVTVVALMHLFPGLLVLHYITKYQDVAFSTGSYDATLMAQIIYAVLGFCSTSIVVAVPWCIPLQNHTLSVHQRKAWGSCFRDSAYVIGLSYVYYWSLLQLLLQQPINSMPVLFLFLQVLASICHGSTSNQHLRQWVEVAALYFMGMAGHFGLGNTNTLATIDVAGSFIGVLNHSTVLCGILMFIITYASPMLYLLSMVMYSSASGFIVSQKGDFGSLLKRTLGFPCLVPLGLNSVLLISYTIVLLLMRNHLFVWSVFSPKFMYVCAMTVCVCLGVSVVASTVIYICLVLASREKLHTHTD
ncbi:GPI ethanolamine phosphate transferase 2 isoform X1 [Lycium barbarum]|uniref:GPI ethanolamine phosphate transferase 2 isoform X1 n=1 Tax=Lycium barbarum TaxID=112863 RepID=UPI00293F4B13|nr:GPI ethanolamine phosphate transferase 2 isoform X1 [Lycium barbarum]